MWLFGYKILHVFLQYDLWAMNEIYLTIFIYPIAVPRSPADR